MKRMTDQNFVCAANLKVTTKTIAVKIVKLGIHKSLE